MPTVTIRSTLGRVGAALAALAVTWAAAWTWLSNGPRAALGAAGGGLLLLVAVWALWWAPSVVLTNASLLVRNAWRQHSVAWDSLERCRTTWSLEVVLDTGVVVKASAAQRSGGMTSSWRKRQELRETARSGKGAAHRPHPSAHAVVDRDLITPGPGRHTTSLDSVAAGDLIEAYAERRAVNESLRPVQDQSAATATGVTSSWRAEPFVALVLAGACLLLSTLL